MAKPLTDKQASAAHDLQLAARRGTSNRKKFEAANPARHDDLAASLGKQWGGDDALHTKIKKAGFDPGQEIDKHVAATRAMGAGSAYRAMGWTHNEQETSTNHPGQGTLFAGDHLMDNPKRWEDHSPKEQKRIRVAAAAHGVTEDSATKAYSSQLDSAHVREGGQHSSFYSEEGHSADGSMSPRTRLKTSAVENHVPFHLQVAANAITSPQNRFLHKNLGTGETTYPNDQAATGAIKWADSGKTGSEYLHHPDYHVPREDKVMNKATGKPEKAPGETRGYPLNGYPKNVETAVNVTHAVLGGTPLKEAWKPTGGDKVRAYHNAWSDPKSPEGNFFVSDTHSGAGGMAPHLADNGPRESAYLGIQGIHAFHDHIARKVNEQRGMTSVSRAQSAQWNEEKLGEGHKGDVESLTHSASPNLSHGQFHGEVKGQQGLWS